MFISIRLKLFALMVLANAVLVAGLLLVNAVSFDRSFNQYIERQESRRLSSLIENLGSTYEAEGDWAWLSWQNPIFKAVLKDSLSRRDERALNHLAPPKREDRGNRAHGPQDFVGRWIITDASKKTVLLGRQRISDAMVWLPITTQNNLVGYLGFEPSTRLDNEVDRLFAAQQLRQLIFIGVIGLVVSAVLAIPFSGWLVRPIRRLTQAVRNMTEGDLNVHLNDTQKDELGQLSKDVNRLAQTLKQSTEDRRQWVSDIAHELRTPVAVIQADIEAAQDGIRQVNERWLSQLHCHAQRLSLLINDLHQLSQSDAGALTYRFEEVDLSTLLDDVLGQFSQQSNAEFIHLDWQAPSALANVRGDSARLMQLFSNLMQNTARYTDGDVDVLGRLRVRITQEAQYIKVNWEDSAPNVATTELPKLFDRLYRVDESRSRATGGSGLGLAIVQNIVDAHEGSITAELSELGGLNMVVRLPIYGSVKV